MSPSRSTTRSRISLASGAGSRSSPVGLIGAVALHLAVIAGALFTWTHRLDIAEESPPVVPVDLVTIAQKTNIAPTIIRPEPKIEPEHIDTPPPPELSMQTPPLPQPTEPAPDVKPAPKVKPEPQKKEMSLDDVLKAATKATPQPAKTPSKDKLADILKQWAAPQQQNGKVAQVAHKGFGQQDANTMDLRDALKNAIEQCWNPPAGAPHPEQLIVQFHLMLNPDGSVSGTPQLTAESNAAASGNPFMRAAADAARRAIYVCSPYKLPPDRYSDWRDSTVNFDPRDLAGQ
jgi:outer membrane biosynthesis protein TonB